MLTQHAIIPYMWPNSRSLNLLRFLPLVFLFVPQFGSADAPPGYILAWSDNFHGNSLDASKWSYRTDSKMSSTQVPANVVVSGGKLYLEIKKRSVGDMPYTGAGVISRRAFEYGYYEAMLRVPPGSGWHTSFWLMKSDGTGATGTHSTLQEIDVCENDSSDPNHYHVNVHRWLPLLHKEYGTGVVPTPDLSQGFHIYGCEFTWRWLTFYFDNKPIESVRVSHFPHSTQNIWLTVIAANLTGNETVDDSKLPSAAVVEYVRFYRKL